jgi:hypothetical protein
MEQITINWWVDEPLLTNEDLEVVSRDLANMVRNIKRSQIHGEEQRLQDSAHGK